MGEYCWAKYSEIFAHPQASEKFTESLVQAKNERLTLLHQTLKHLDTNESPETRDTCVVVIIEGILKLTIHPYQITPDGLVELVNCLLTEARHFSTEVLTKIVSSCIDYMQNNQNIDLPVRWIEIFGKMAAVLTTRDDINFSDDVIDGKEFKSQVITSICRVPWGANNGASVISALREIPGINPADVAMVLDNAASSLINLEPSSVPPIAYQLLLLAGDIRPSSLIYHFDKYFGSVDFGSNSLSDDGITNATKRKALGSTVYFFIQSARHSEALSKEFVKRVRASAYDHNLVITPFTLSVSLGLTSIDHLKNTIVDSLKNTIVKSFTDIHLIGETAWYCRIRGQVSDTVTACFTNVMDAKSSELDFMLDGLKELAMGLLNVEQLQEKDPFAAEKCKALGIYLITSIVKRNREYLPAIMNELLKHQKLPFIECLASCLKSLVRTIVQSSYHNRVVELIQHLPRMTVDTASVLIKALLPALQLSHGLMGEMIEVLRKTIWKSVEARRISLTAMILMLENSKIIGNIPKSQYSENSEAFFSQSSQTQIDVFGNSKSNEPLCFEIISILKRFFSQQLEVKDHLYLELHNVVRKNPELIGVICCQLLTHVKTYTNAHEDLSLEKLLDYSNIRELKLKENLGLLIQCICSVTLRGQKVFRNDTEERPPSLNSCEKFLVQFRNQLLLHGPEYYETQATKHSSGSSQGPLDFWDVRYARNTLINEILGSIEAFIEFTALGGKLSEPVSVQKLFKKYQQLKNEVEKPGAKPKGTTKKKKDARQLHITEIDFGTQDSLRSQQQPGSTQQNNTTTADSSNAAIQQGKTKVKLDGNSIKKKLVYHHVMSLDSVHEIMTEFYGPNEVEVENSLLSVQGDSSFEKYLLAVVSQKLSMLKQKETLKERRRKEREFIETLAGISAALWEVCQSTVSHAHPENARNNESTVTSDELELRLNRLGIISGLLEFLYAKYPAHRTETLKTFNASPYPKETYEDMFSDFFEVWKKVFKKRVAVISVGQNNSLTGELHNLFAILDTFCKFLKPESLQSVEVKKWCEGFITTNPRNLKTSSSLIESFLKPYITCGTKSCRIPKHFVTLARQAHFILEDLDNETQKFAPEDGLSSWLVDDCTAVSVISCFGSHVGSSIKLINEVLGRLKAHSGFIDIEKLGNWRDESCVMMEFLLRLSTELVRSEFSSGACGDILLKAMAQFFATMTNLTLDLIEVHNKNKVDFSSKRYEHLVRLIGKDFKVRVEALITHIEVIGKDACAKSKKGATASLKHKFMKDARSIPDLVYNVEKYERQVIALSKKTKVNLLIGSKLSTARDFRIQMNEVRAGDAPSTTTTSMRQDAAMPRGNVVSSRGSRSKSTSRPPAEVTAAPTPEIQRGLGTQTARRSRGTSSVHRGRVHKSDSAEGCEGEEGPEALEMDNTVVPQRSYIVPVARIPSPADGAEVPKFSLSRKARVKTPMPVSEVAPPPAQREPDMMNIPDEAERSVIKVKSTNVRLKKGDKVAEMPPPAQREPSIPDEAERSVIKVKSTNVRRKKGDKVTEKPPLAASETKTKKRSAEVEPEPSTPAYIHKKKKYAAKNVRPGSPKESTPPPPRRQVRASTSKATATPPPEKKKRTFKVKPVHASTPLERPTLFGGSLRVELMPDYVGPPIDWSSLTSAYPSPIIGNETDEGNGGRGFKPTLPAADNQSSVPEDGQCSPTNLEALPPPPIASCGSGTSSTTKPAMRQMGLKRKRGT